MPISTNHPSETDEHQKAASPHRPDGQLPEQEPTNRRLPFSTLSGALVALGMVIVTAGGAACVEHSDEQSPGYPVDVGSPVDQGKADGLDVGNAFPAAADLTLIVPIEDTNIVATDVFPETWLDQVDSALLASELAESIADENWVDDWRLVSGRFVACSPLGKVAGPEMERLCWPQIRLVWQPIVENLRVGATIRDYYADDRAIHTLYRFDHDDVELDRVLSLLSNGARIETIPPDVLASFEEARDRASAALLERLRQLRREGSGYGRIAARPEFFTSNRDEFLLALRGMLEDLCQPEALHELTAFSLPLGRNPAASNLWSFVAFEGRGGTLHPTPLAIHAADTGEKLFEFAHSEDVTTDLGDHEIEEALAFMTTEVREALRAQVVFDTADVPELQDRINDPARTLVANTSCSSCHRMTDLDFNFHNLSYFESNGFSLAPRVVRDVARDVDAARRIWRP